MEEIMAIDFDTLLTVDEKANILTQRIKQFAAEGYQINLNKQVAESTENAAGVEEADKNLVIIEEAINTYKAELDSLPTAE
jgi:hypothetical protein